MQARAFLRRLHRNLGDKSALTNRQLPTHSIQAATADGSKKSTQNYLEDDFDCFPHSSVHNFGDAVPYGRSLRGRAESWLLVAARVARRERGLAIRCVGCSTRYKSNACVQHNHARVLDSCGNVHCVLGGRAEPARVRGACAIIRC